MGGIKVLRVFGIDICVDASGILLGFLIFWSFWGVFVGKSNGLVLGVLINLLAVFLFYFSLLSHELAHCLVGRKVGFVCKKIALIFFGAVAIIEKENFGVARAELLMASAGPAASFILSAFFYGLFATSNFFEIATASSVFSFMFKLNLILGLFNLIPCLPMDGGRIFRSILNMILKDFLKASKVAFKTADLIILGVILFGVTGLIFGYNTLYYILIAIFVRILGNGERKYTLKQNTN